MAKIIDNENGDEVAADSTELGRKLVVALRSVSDPQALMQSIADRVAVNLRSELLTKITAMEQATNLWHEDLVRVPTDVQKSTEGLRDLLEQYIGRSISDLRSELSDKRESLHATLGRENEKLQGLVDTLDKVSEERFKSVSQQFTLLKQATEQLDSANKTAIAAALQAQKESAGETQKSSQAAIAKSETSTSEAIKALTTTFNTAIGGLTDRYNDLKSRIDRGEGGSNVRDPALTSMLDRMNAQLISLNTTRDTHSGSEKTATDNSTRMMSIAAVVVSLAVGIGEIFTRMH